MKKVVLWALSVFVFLFYVYNENKDWRENMINKYGYVYVTEYGEKYHAQYHYSDRNESISMLSAYERGLDPCSVCQSPPIADFDMEKDKLTWYVKHWFVTIVIGTIGYIYLLYRLNP